MVSQVFLTKKKAPCIKRSNTMSTNTEIMEAIETYQAENAKFEEKGVKASAARARKALGDIGKLTKVRRAEIQDKKNNM